MAARADAALRFLELTWFADSLAAGLPAGTQRIIEVGRVLVASPRLVLFDEPAAGLDHTETLELADVLRAVSAVHGEVRPGGAPGDLSGLEDNTGGEVSRRVDVSASDQGREELACVVLGSTPLAAPQEHRRSAAPRRASLLLSPVSADERYEEGSAGEDEGRRGHRETSWVGPGAIGALAGCWEGPRPWDRLRAVWARRRWSSCSRLPGRSGPRARGSSVRLQRSR